MRRGGRDSHIPIGISVEGECAGKLLSFVAQSEKEPQDACFVITARGIWG